MQLRNCIEEGLIVSDMRVDSKEAAIEVLIDRMFSARPEVFGDGLSKDKVFDEVMKREATRTTGIGKGLAFPHARIDEFTGFVAAMGLNKTPIDFGSVDEKGCHFICLMISGTKKPYIILQTMAAFMRFFVEGNHGWETLAGLSSKQIAKVFNGSEEVAGKLISASEIMRPVKRYVELDTPIEDTVRLMHLKGFDTLPVVDSEMNLCGQISSLDIFQSGIPDFFNELQTVSFVRNLDPFEKYFKFKKSLKVRDMYRPTKAMINRDSTLMEIVFAMTVKKNPKLFVLDKGRLVGVIDRFSIIDKIFFL